MSTHEFGALLASCHLDTDTDVKFNFIDCFVLSFFFFCLFVFVLFLFGGEEVKL